jgi:hypothetical protein
LPMIVNAFNPWLSSADINKGARWNSDLAAALATSKAGIICLTPHNLTAPYILFESGALSRTVDKAFVCTLLIGMEPSDVSGPLAQFQATKPTKDDMLQLLRTLNKAAESSIKDSQVEATFGLVWPKLKEKLDNLPPDGSPARPQRKERELLEELVDSVRSATAQGAQDTDTLHQVSGLVARIADRVASLEASVRAIDHPSYVWNTDDIAGSYAAAAAGLGGKPLWPRPPEVPQPPNLPPPRKRASRLRGFRPRVEVQPKPESEATPGLEARGSATIHKPEK